MASQTFQFLFKQSVVILTFLLFLSSSNVNQYLKPFLISQIPLKISQQQTAKLTYYQHREHLYYLMIDKFPQPKPKELIFKMEAKPQGKPFYMQFYGKKEAKIKQQGNEQMKRQGRKNKQIINENSNLIKFCDRPTGDICRIPIQKIKQQTIYVVSIFGGDDIQYQIKFEWEQGNTIQHLDSGSKIIQMKVRQLSNGKLYARSFLHIEYISKLFDEIQLQVIKIPSSPLPKSSSPLPLPSLAPSPPHNLTLFINKNLTKPSPKNYTHKSSSFPILNNVGGWVGIYGEVAVIAKQEIYEKIQQINKEMKGGLAVLVVDGEWEEGMVYQQVNQSVGKQNGEIWKYQIISTFVTRFKSQNEENRKNLQIRLSDAGKPSTKQKQSQTQFNHQHNYSLESQSQPSSSSQLFLFWVIATSVFILMGYFLCRNLCSREQTQSHYQQNQEKDVQSSWDFRANQKQASQSKWEGNIPKQVKNIQIYRQT